MVNNFKFLCVHISEKLKWSNHMDTMVKQAQQQLFNIRMLKKCVLSLRALIVFYRSTNETILLAASQPGTATPLLWTAKRFRA